MSEVNASIVVQPITATIIVDNNNINFTPTVTDLSIYTGATSYQITSLDADISNVHISGGVNGYVLETDGLGNLSWTAQTSGTGNGIPGGSNTQIQFNDAGDFGGNSGFTFDKTTGNVVAANFVGNLSGTATTANYSWHAFVADTANVSNTANYSTYSGTAFSVSGANVSGEVAFAATANAVAGANVSGQVTFAATANAVAGGNVSGAVAFATTANAVAGANVSGAVGLATYSTTANAVAGANVSGQVNYAATANAVAGANVSGAVGLATYSTTANAVAGANVSGQVNYAATANAVAGGNVSGAVAFATTANAVAGANVSGAVAFATTANAVAGANVSGYVANANHSNIADAANAVAGANVSGTVANANYAAYAGNVTIAAQGNITSVGTLTSLNIAGTTSIQQAKEKVTANSVAATGTINYDLLTQAIVFNTVNASNNFTLNFRGNATTTLDSIMLSNQSMTCSFINTNGTTGYYANVINVDGNLITPLLPGALSGTVSGKDIYTFNIIKIAANTFTVFQSAVGYV